MKSAIALGQTNISREGFKRLLGSRVTDD